MEQIKKEVVTKNKSQPLVNGVQKLASAVISSTKRKI